MTFERNDREIADVCLITTTVYATTTAMDTAPMARAKGFVDKEEKLMCCEEFMYE
jgi:hypothetical protein